MILMQHRYSPRILAQTQIELKPNFQETEVKKGNLKNSEKKAEMKSQQVEEMKRIN
jgi:hypothetical protein